MKTAICFSGAIRSFNACYPSIKRFFLDNCGDYDIFIHMWVIDEIDKDLEIDFKIRKSNCDVEKIIEILKPKKYVVDNYDSKWEKEIVESINMQDCDFRDKKNYGFSAMGMYFKINKANQLKCQYEKENDFKYDFVWRARLDYIFLQPLEMPMPQEIKDKTVYLIRDRYATRSRIPTNDKFFGGTSETIDKMCNIYYQIREYYLNGFLIEGQSLCQNHIQLSGFEHQFLGNEQTYYKCQGRHEINSNKGCIHVNKIDNRLAYNIVYHLLYNNYGIICEETQVGQEYRELLVFNNFYKEKGKKRIVSTVNSINSTTISINSITIETIDSLINNIWLCHFILSLFRNNIINEKNTYKLTKTHKINLEKGDKVEYLIADRGFYQGTIENCFKNNTYQILPIIESTIQGSYIIPWKLANCYIENSLPIF